MKSIALAAILGSAAPMPSGVEALDYPFFDSCVRGAQIVASVTVIVAEDKQEAFQAQIEDGCRDIPPELAAKIREKFPVTSAKDRVELGCGFGAGMMGASWAKLMDKDPRDYTDQLKRLAVRCAENQVLKL